jgi:hypothetical protein
VIYITHAVYTKGNFSALVLDLKDRYQRVPDLVRSLPSTKFSPAILNCAESIDRVLMDYAADRFHLSDDARECMDRIRDSFTRHYILNEADRQRYASEFSSSHLPTEEREVVHQLKNKLQPLIGFCRFVSDSSAMEVMDIAASMMDILANYEHIYTGPQSKI